MLDFEKSGKSFEVIKNKKDSDLLIMYILIWVAPEINSSAVPFHADPSSATSFMLSWIVAFEQFRTIPRSGILSVQPTSV